MKNKDDCGFQSDLQLLSEIREGQSGAFDALSRRYEPMTEGAVRRFSASFPNAEGDSVWDEDDLRQCAAMALYRAAVSYDPKEGGEKVRFGLYAKICVNNALISELRKARTRAKSRGRRRDSPASSRQRPDPLEELLSSEGFQDLTSSIRSSLAPLERDVFEKVMSGLSVEQIASVLGRDPKSVSNALYRMKVKIREILQKES